MHRPLVTIERTKYYLSGVDPSGRFGVEGDAVEDGLEVFGEEFAKEGTRIIQCFIYILNCA